MNAPVAPPRMSLLGYNNSGNRKSDPSPKKYQPALYEYCDPQELLNGNIAEEEENAYSCPTLISTQQDEIYEDFGLASKNESFVPANTFQGVFETKKQQTITKCESTFGCVFKNVEDDVCVLYFVDFLFTFNLLLFG
eukprot:m.115315 g.115315  ORF g.115315 m.115315 type:complete len:137 (-) comp28412_c0_seq1:215-625(-)